MKKAANFSSPPGGMFYQQNKLTAGKKFPLLVFTKRKGTINDYTWILLC